MSAAKHRVRIDNIKRAKNAWQLKLGGLKPEKIAQRLSVTANTINRILKHTNSSYYLAFTGDESYYDAKVTVKIKIEKNRKKLREINNYVARKKLMLIRMFEATAILIAFLIII